MALLDFEGCYYNTSVPIMPPKNFTFDSWHSYLLHLQEKGNNILFANQQ